MGTKVDLEEIHNVFKLPIEYNQDTKVLKNDIINELELTKSINNKELPIYECIFDTKNQLSKTILNKTVTKYTTNIQFLQETQELIRLSSKKPYSDEHIHNNMLASWKEIKEETGFCEKYLFVSWSFAKDLNSNPHFLQIMSLYNIISPILSLCLPIIVLLVPFFIIKMKGLQINLKEYIEVLKVIIKNNALTKIFTEFNSVSNGQKVYMLFSAFFYLFSIYQNILICVKFYSNMKKIHDYLAQIKEYLIFTTQIMEQHIEICKNLITYKPYLNDLQEKYIQIKTTLLDELTKITSFSVSFTKVTEIGHIMSTFYKLHTSTEHNELILYAFGLNGYIELIHTLSTQITTKSMNFTTYADVSSNCFKHIYYPKFITSSNNCVKNDCDLSSNIIITGPNASGKTTMLKTILINSILSQQFGLGCYTEAIINPYDNFYCYLNIPDTSGRDSLFQAEARRCKEIIDNISLEPNQRHLCIFDELYSGTNPEEAVSSAYAFMKFLCNNKNVKCLLTTHFIKLCKRLSKHTNINCFNMKTTKINGKLKFKYILIEGISKIKGGINVLKDMNYPKEILENI